MITTNYAKLLIIMLNLY